MVMRLLLLPALTLTLGAAPPEGYPSPPVGYHWAVYPSGPHAGRWGLVQDGLTLGGCPDGKCQLRQAAPATAGVSPVASSPQAGEDALAEVNAKRAARGLRPYLRDEGLTVAARAAAAFRAARLMFGHVMTGRGDFQFLPPGVHAAAGGCAAYPPGYGWMSCAVYDNYTYCGAAWVMGRDGKRYCHLFVR